ncbi:histidine kinase [Hydrogenophaga crassostreae]|uniref:Histidine kinase n=1 Tax=Hydrogenophaga crassostreae TaxID=1763535 RepID=A0A167H4E7_9BURK|nr:HDOD domain-containing protein [Hydrogenophaga crassostreae]AOW13074.1 histidine kinase [Hydrogenophaga crassostreae]OAD40259.1 histidine kinase [Hydrogenophaga crassostreae]
MSAASTFTQSINLPTMPEVAHELIQSLNDEDVPVAPVRNAIAKDPALTVKLLRLANSARYGVSKEVSSVDDAMMVVGMSQVRTLALSSCLSDAFPVVAGLNSKDFWSESQACAGYAQWLATRVGSDPQQAWLTGFMVRLGELVIVDKAPEALPEIERTPHFPGARWQREAAHLGFTEGQITAEMARRWNFPAVISDALESSADPLAKRPFCRLGAVLHLAELMCLLKEEDNPDLKEVPQELLTALHIEREWLREQLPKAREFAQAAVLH